MRGRRSRSRDRHTRARSRDGRSPVDSENDDSEDRTDSKKEKRQVRGV